MIYILFNTSWCIYMNQSGNHACTQNILYPTVNHVVCCHSNRVHICIVLFFLCHLGDSLPSYIESAEYAVAGDVIALNDRPLPQLPSDSEVMIEFDL